MFIKKRKLQSLSLAISIVLVSPQVVYAIEIDPKRCEEASKVCEEKAMAAWRNHDWFGEEAEYFATLAMHKCQEIKKECLDVAVKHAPTSK